MAKHSAAHRSEQATTTENSDYGELGLAPSIGSLIQTVIVLTDGVRHHLLKPGSSRFLDDVISSSVLYWVHSTRASLLARSLLTSRVVYKHSQTPYVSCIAFHSKTIHTYHTYSGGTITAH